jgi:hypothetical protein
VDIFEKVTVKLSHEQVVKIIEEYLTSKGYQTKSMSAQLTTRCVGYGPMERDEIIFTGFTVEVEKLLGGI